MPKIPKKVTPELKQNQFISVRVVGKHSTSKYATSVYLFGGCFLNMQKYSERPSCAFQRFELRISCL